MREKLRVVGVRSISRQRGFGWRCLGCDMSESKSEGIDMLASTWWKASRLDGKNQTSHQHPAIFHFRLYTTQTPLLYPNIRRHFVRYMANPLNTTKDSLTTDKSVVRLTTSPHGLSYTFCCFLGRRGVGARGSFLGQVLLFWWRKSAVKGEWLNALVHGVCSHQLKEPLSQSNESVQCHSCERPHAYLATKTWCTVPTSNKHCFFILYVDS